MIGVIIVSVLAAWTIGYICGYVHGTVRADTDNYERWRRGEIHNPSCPRPPKDWS